VNAEFNWWLLIVGLVIGAGVVWLILADTARREVDVDRQERAGEARWIGDELRRAGRSVDDDTVADVLDLHAAYLGAPPPDEPIDDEIVEDEPGAAPTAPAPPVSAAAPTTPPSPAGRTWTSVETAPAADSERRPV
jgi:hypothetical protein